MSIETIRFTRGVPPVECFPTHQLIDCARQALAEHCDVVLQYGSAWGFPPLRAHLAREAGVPESQVIIGHGSLLLQDFCARALLQPGSLVYVEEPSYDRAITVLRRVGARVEGIPLEDDGPDVDALAERLRHGDRPDLFYVIPDFQNPSGTVLSAEKRERLAALAREYGFWIVEDVPYRPLRYRGTEERTLFDLAPDRVLQMSSFSKLISPGLRVGYVIAPDAVAKKVARIAEDSYINASYLNQAMVYQYIQNGWLEPNIAKLKEVYAPRLDATLRALDHHMSDLATWRKPDGGFFVGITLRDHRGEVAAVDAGELLVRARAAGLELTDGRGFYVNGGGDSFVRLPFCALTPSEIETGVGRLAAVVRDLVG